VFFSSEITQSEQVVENAKRRKDEKGETGKKLFKNII
jgi:hypothetical protein